MPTTAFDKWKAIQCWQFVFIKLLLPELISKKAPSNPWIADNSRKKSAQGWDLHLKFILLSSKKVDGSKTKRQTSKNTWTPIHTHEQPWTSMDAHEHSSAWAPMNSHELVFFQIQCSWQITCWTICLTVFEFLFWVVGYASFWFDCFFLELNIISIFMCYVFLFCPVVASCPKKILADFCKTWFVINIYVYSHSFIYSKIYIYIYVMLCIFIYSIISIYIYTCVCVRGAGLPQNEVSSFPLKEPFLEPKKDRHIHVYNIYIYWQVFFFILCWFVPSKIYVFWFSFVCSFSASFYRKKCIKPKSVSLEITI